MKDGRIYVEKTNEPLLSELKGTPADYKTGLERAIANGRHWLDEGGRFSRSSRTSAALFAWLRAAIEKGRPLLAGDPRPGSK